MDATFSVIVLGGGLLEYNTLINAKNEIKTPLLYSLQKPKTLKNECF